MIVALPSMPRCSPAIQRKVLGLYPYLHTTKQIELRTIL